MASTVSDNIEGHRMALRPVVDSMKGQWEGTARPAFDAAHQQWEAGIVRLNAALQHLGQSTQFSANTYDAADQASAHGLNSVGSMSPFGGVLSA